MATYIDTDPNDAVTTYPQPTNVPTAKVKAVGYAGVVTTLVPLIVTALALLNVHVGDPDAVSTGVIAVIGAVVTIYNAVSAALLFLAGYFKKSDTANGAVKKL